MEPVAGITRRAFIEAGMVGGVATVLGPAAIAAGKPVETVRLGVIGVGGRGTGLLETALAVPGVEVRALCDVVASRAERARRIVDAKTSRRPEIYVKDEFAWRGLVCRDDLDAVIIATPWEWHAQMAVGAMRAGKYAGVEVPAAITIEECWELVRTSEQTGKPCMMLENVCYFQNVLALLRMVREGLFGDLLHCEAGYQHDCRSLMFDTADQLSWRGRHAADKNGNLYPTHPIGPVAQWMNINHGDRFIQVVSMSTPAKGLREYAAKRFGPQHVTARRDYAQGDINTTLLKTANGLTATLYFDMLTHRPYDLIFRVQGVKGIYSGTLNKICLEGAVGAGTEVWQPFEPYLTKYAHPLWKALGETALSNGGHGGADYVMMHDWLSAVRKKAQTPQDVYDAATWSAVFPLSIDSVAKGSQPVEFPDFTKGRWKTDRK
jgi:predicted dehydrogenase